mmetsp:Transcript_118388/g.315083  ORF Transcript_118388/g.315083 Transcript_118388/m.315083 type:complete len:210 (-) Transcript_118388:114-743(-)
MGNAVQAQVCCGLGDRRHAVPFPSPHEYKKFNLQPDSTSKEASPTASSSQRAPSGPTPNEKAREKEEKDRTTVEEIQRHASRIETLCKKFPTSGHHGCFTGAKERYIVAVPAPDAGGIPGKGWAKSLGRWRRGTLGYWGSRDAYEKKLSAKGEIELRNIIKVQWDGKSPDEVLIKHFDGKETAKLELHFEDEHKAKQWRDALRGLRSLL